MTRLVAPLTLLVLGLSSMPAAAADADGTTSGLDAIRRGGIYSASTAVALPSAEAAAGAPATTLSLPRVAPSRPTVLASMYVGLVALQAYDAYSTHSALKLGAEEMNQLFAGKMAHPAAQIAVKGAVTAFSIYAAETLWKRKQRVAAVALMAATNGLMALVAANNASVLRGQR